MRFIKIDDHLASKEDDEGFAIPEADA